MAYSPERSGEVGTKLTGFQLGEGEGAEKEREGEGERERERETGRVPRSPQGQTGNYCRAQS